MDPKRKRIYIIIIVVCVLGMVGVWLWGRSGSPSPDFSGINNLVGTPSPSPSSSNTGLLQPLIDGTYPAPVVFPQNTKLDTSILEPSSNFSLLKPYKPTTISPSELNRDDPFKSY